MVARQGHSLEVGGSSPSPATMYKDKDIEQFIADAVMARPYSFSVGEEHFNLYPVTLGKMFLLQRQTENLGIDEKALQYDIALEALRLVKSKKDECLTIICYHTCKDKNEVFDNVLISKRKEVFKENLSDEDIAALMITVLTSDKTSLFTKHLGIDVENDRLNAVMKIKKQNDKNNIGFGGLSVFGSIIDVACERYGWTKDYVVWGIDYTSLRLMLADKVNSVYCSDEELTQIPANIRKKNDDSIKPTKENMETILSMNWK